MADFEKGEHVFCFINDDKVVGVFEGNIIRVSRHEDDLYHVFLPTLHDELEKTRLYQFDRTDHYYVYNRYIFRTKDEADFAYFKHIRQQLKDACAVFFTGCNKIGHCNGDLCPLYGCDCKKIFKRFTGNWMD